MPSSTDARIEELCSRIGALCQGLLSPETETEVRRLARELRLVIRQHVGMAKSSLVAKRAALVGVERDNDAKFPADRKAS